MPRPAVARSQAVIWSVVAISAVGMYLLLRPATSSPGMDASAYRQVASALAERARPREARQVMEKCAHGSDCECVVTTAKLALDRDLHAEALRLIEGKLTACQAQVAGLHAEALARAGKLEPARAAASAVLKVRPQDPHATYALAQAHYTEGDAAQAKVQAQLAVDRGRGPAANLLLGLVAFNSGDYEAATDAFNKMLQDDPENVDAHYNLAVVAHRLNQYRNAREGYLKTLHLFPKHLDARFNLALLTHAAGAQAEARHHLKKLTEVAPAGDERVRKLEAAFESGPPASSTMMITPQRSAAPDPSAR